jgi:hypothetical protein
MTKCRGDAIEMDRSDMAYQIVPISKLCGRENDRTGEEKRREEKRREERRRKWPKKQEVYLSNDLGRLSEHRDLHDAR